MVTADKAIPLRILFVLVNFLLKRFDALFKFPNNLFLILKIFHQENLSESGCLSSHINEEISGKLPN